MMAEIQRVALLLAFLVTWITTGAAATTTPKPMTEYEDIKCRFEWNCEPEQFCNHETGTCSKCMDCSEFHMDPGRTDCPKGKQDCGGCWKGFVVDEDGGHCSPDIPPPPIISVPTQETSTSSDGVGWSLIVAFVLVCGAIIFGGTQYRKYSKIRARQSVSSESLPERKSLISGLGRGQGGQFSSNGNCEQGIGSSATSAPPENP